MYSPPPSASSPTYTTEHALHTLPSIPLSVRADEQTLTTSLSQRAASLDNQGLIEHFQADSERMRAEEPAIRELEASKVPPSNSLESDYGSDEDYKGNVGQYDDLTIVEEPRTRRQHQRAPSFEYDLALQMALLASTSEGRQSLRQQARDRRRLYGALSALHASTESEAATRSRPLASTPSPVAPAVRAPPAPAVSAPPAPPGAQSAPTTRTPADFAGSRPLTHGMKQRIREFTLPLL